MEFLADLATINEKLNGTVEQAFEREASSFLLFRFEAAIQLQNWGDALQIARVCSKRCRMSEGELNMKQESKAFGDFEIQALLGDLILSLGHSTSGKFLFRQGMKSAD